MKRPKLNYRFHNPNKDDEALINELLKVCIEANKKKVERAIREAALRENVSRAVWLDEPAMIADMGEETLFKMPNGENEGKYYTIPNEYIKKEEGYYVLQLPPDFMVELNERGEVVEKLSVDQFIKAVGMKTAEDYASRYAKGPRVLYEEQERKRIADIEAKKRVSSNQNCK